MCKRFFDNDGLRRLEAILDATFADLRIRRDSHYAQCTREYLATLLLTLPVDELTNAEARMQLTGRLSAFETVRGPLHATTSEPA